MKNMATENRSLAGKDKKRALKPLIFRKKESDLSHLNISLKGFVKLRSKRTVHLGHVIRKVEPFLTGTLSLVLQPGQLTTLSGLLILSIIFFIKETLQ